MSNDMSPEQFEELVNSGKFHEAAPIIEKPVNAVKPDVAPKEEEPAPLPVVVEPAPSKIEYTQGEKYAGDFDEEEAAAPKDGFAAMDFKSPVHMLAFFDDDIANGSVKLYKWQAEIGMDLAPDEKPSSLKPLRYYLVAANGSGKDAFVIAPFAIWFLLCKIKSRVIITSSSGTQLTSQTETYIKNLAQRVNQKLGQPVFRIRQRYIRCNTSGSEIRMFATDEAGKAEGYHPMEPNAEMAIIKNESKSISDEIHRALKRCNGFNYWLEISSPGAPQGAFYFAVTNWPRGRKITSYDCPHISEEERTIDKLELGENSPEYRSKHLAEFTSVDGETVIPGHIVTRCRENPPSFSFPSWPKRVGIDLAAGCDETCITIVQGTKVLVEKAFPERDTIIAAGRLEKILEDNSIPKNSEFIYADDGGVGHAIIDNLMHRGWSINRVLNQSAAWNKRQYGNKGAELYFRVKRIIEENCFNLFGLSQKTLDQLSNRKYKQPAGGRLFLQPKREMKAEGLNSPDRADAFVLSLTGLTINDFLGDGSKDVEDEVPKRKRLNNDAEVMDFYDGITFKEYEMITHDNFRSGKKARNSLQVALGIGGTETKGKYL